MCMNSKSIMLMQTTKLFYINFVQDVSKGIDGSVSSYTFNFTYSNSECGSILIPFSATSCKSGVCTLEDKSIICCFSESSEVVVTAFASNILGDGVPSDAIHIGRSSQQAIQSCTSLFITNILCVYIIMLLYILHRNSE